MAEPFGAAREAPKGLDPGGDELAEADGSHCESVALEHKRAQPDGRARVGDELARLEVLLGNGGVVEQRRPLGTSLPRTSHVPRASLPRADCLQPRCSSRFVARSYHPPAKGDLVMSWRQSNGTRAAEAQRAHLTSSNLLSTASRCVGGAFRCWPPHRRVPCHLDVVSSTRSLFSFLSRQTEGTSSHHYLAPRPL